MSSKQHIPVLVQESLQYFAQTNLEVFFDGTLGAGGHAKAFLTAHPEIRLYIGCDQDKRALEIAKQELKDWSDKVLFVHGNFRHLDQYLQELKVEQVNGFFLT